MTIGTIFKIFEAMNSEIYFEVKDQGLMNVQK